MKNIFEILKHEDHKLEIIKIDKDIQLGCIECGCKLISFKEDLLTEEFNDIERNIEDRQMGEYINQMYKEATYLEEEIECLAKKIIDETNSLLEKYSTRKNFMEHTAGIILKSELMKEVELKIKKEYDMTIKLHEKYKESKMLKENISIVVNQLENKIIEIINKEESCFIALRYEEEYSCSYHVFKNDQEGTLLTIRKESLEREEKENPTIKEVIEINNMNEYYKIFPDIEDEEEETYKYRKFIYLSREGLLRLKPEVEIKVLENMLKEYTWLYEDEYIDNKLATIESVKQIIERMKKNL